MAAQITQGPGRFAGKVVVITGAAGGIGRASALRLAREGADIVGLDLSGDGLETLTEEIRALGRGCETVTGSVTDFSVVDAAIGRAIDVFGGFDGLVNNAGIAGSMKRFDRIESEEFDAIVAINLKAVWYGVKAAYRPLRERGGGAIVNVASMAGLRPNWRHSPYGITKAAVVSLTQHAAMDYAADHIRVNCLCPGPIDTPMFEQMRAVMEPAAYQASRRQIEQRTLMNRFGIAEEQAAAVAFLLSDEASYVTGIAMPVDGGWSISDGHAH